VIDQFGRWIQIQYNKFIGNDQSHFKEKKIHILSNCQNLSDTKYI